jgi:hypothetical protein
MVNLQFSKLRDDLIKRLPPWRQLRDQDEVDAAYAKAKVHFDTFRHKLRAGTMVMVDGESNSTVLDSEMTQLVLAVAHYEEHGEVNRTACIFTVGE